MTKNVTLMAMMVFSGIGMTWISHRKLSQRDSVQHCPALSSTVCRDRLLTFDAAGVILGTDARPRTIYPILTNMIFFICLCLREKRIITT